MTLVHLLFAFFPLVSSPEAEGVSSRRMLTWLDACEKKIDGVHGFVLLKNGKLIAEGSWAPFDTLNRPHRLSSHSKCFVSTAAGMLVDDGKLDLDERVFDILTDLYPAETSENQRAVRVRDLMTMTMGSSQSTAGWREEVAKDWLRHKLALPVSHKPGQHYEYDSDATHVLGEVVARKSGMPLMDFLKKRLFDPLGMTKAWTTYDPSGKPCAGWGFNMTTREISCIGQLYLDKGVWNGQRLLSEDWVRAATAKQTWSGKTQKDFQPNNDWTYGFGFNLWRCQHGCYRADGAAGQYTIVFPEHKAVLSIHADVESMQALLDIVWADFLPVLSVDPLPADVEGTKLLRARCTSLALEPVAGARAGSEKWAGRLAAFKDRPVGGIRSFRVDSCEDGWKLTLNTEAGTFVVPVGSGRWLTSEVVFSSCAYEKLGDIVGTQHVAASGGVQPDGSFRVRMQLLDGTHRFDFIFRRKFLKDVAEVGSVGVTWGKFIEAHFR